MVCPGVQLSVHTACFAVFVFFLSRKFKVFLLWHYCRTPGKHCQYYCIKSIFSGNYLILEIVVKSLTVSSMCEMGHFLRLVRGLFIYDLVLCASIKIASFSRHSLESDAVVVFVKYNQTTAERIRWVTDGPTNQEAIRRTDSQIDHTDRQTGRKMDRQTDRQAGIQQDNSETDRQTETQPGRHLGRQTGCLLLPVCRLGGHCPLRKMFSNCPTKQILFLLHRTP